MIRQSVNECVEYVFFQAEAGIRYIGVTGVQTCALPICDLCLVHNGSLSNHNRWRAWLRDHGGIEFQTENDTEVAAGYLTHRLQAGAGLDEALTSALADREDGLVGKRGGPGGRRQI